MTSWATRLGCWPGSYLEAVFAHTSLDWRRLVEIAPRCFRLSSENALWGTSKVRRASGLGAQGELRRSGVDHGGRRPAAPAGTAPMPGRDPAVEPGARPENCWRSAGSTPWVGRPRCPSKKAWGADVAILRVYKIQFSGSLQRFRCIKQLPVGLCGVACAVLVLTPFY